jgi:hypothetical protein
MEPGKEQISQGYLTLDLSLPTTVNHHWPVLTYTDTYTNQYQ